MCTYGRFEKLRTFCGHINMPLYCALMDAQNRYVITGADDRLVKVWGAHTGKLLYTLRGHQDHITDLAIGLWGLRVL